MGKPIDFDMEKLKEWYFEEKASLAEIARRCGCSSNHLVKKLKEFGMYIPDKERIRTCQKEATYENLYYEYIECGKSWEELQEIFGYSEVWLRRRIRSLGIHRTTEQIQERMKQTSLDKYGTEWANSSEEILAKRRDTCQKKYGANSFFASEQGKKIKEESTMQKYGVSNVFFLPEMQAKAQETKKEKYPDYESRTSIRVKTSETSLKKYGTLFPQQSEEVKKKMRDSTMERYGVTNWGKTKSTQLSLHALSSKENLEEFILSQENRISVNLSKTLGCGHSTFLKAVHKYALDNLVDYWHSEPEHELREFIVSLGIKQELSRVIIFPYEIDIYCPEYQIGIEFDGNYYHSELKKSHEYHQTKSNLAKGKDIFLFHVFEYDWRNPDKKEYIKNILKRLFGSNFLTGTQLRDYTIRHVDEKEARSFLSKSYPWTVPEGGVYVALEIDGVPIYLARFTQNGTNHYLEGFFYAGDAFVAGGEKAIVDYYIVNHSKESSLFYISDAATISPEFCKEIGFVNFVEQTEPDFIWTNGNCEVLEQGEATDKEMLAQNNYRIYDCGKNIWSR